MILLVDKDPISADSIAYYLEAAGYQVETMFDARQALERAAALDPELVLMEVILSGVNGLALAQAFNSDPRTCHVPILMVSVLAAEPQAKKAGADAFLSKPVDRQQLLSAVSAARSAGGRCS
jgi:two-component system cell cycle response regulator DivK